MAPINAGIMGFQITPDPGVIEVNIHPVASWDALGSQNQAGYVFEADWFRPFLEFRFPIYGVASLADGLVELELRHAIESWPVVGDSAGASQLVDTSLERLQVTLRGVAGEVYDVVCNHCQLPLATVEPNERPAGVRFRARQFAQTVHPAIAPHRSLVFDVVHRATGNSLGGCTYYPQLSKAEQNLPSNSTEANRRMAQRFVVHGPRKIIPYTASPTHPAYPNTLDLRHVNSSLEGLPSKCGNHVCSAEQL